MTALDDRDFGIRLNQCGPNGFVYLVDEAPPANPLDRLIDQSGSAVTVERDLAWATNRTETVSQDEWDGWKEGSRPGFKKMWGIRVEDPRWFSAKDKSSSYTYRWRREVSAVSVLLSESAVAEAKAILAGDFRHRRVAVERFVRSHANYVYVGKFCLGTVSKAKGKGSKKGKKKAESILPSFFHTDYDSCDYNWESSDDNASEKFFPHVNAVKLDYLPLYEIMEVSAGVYNEPKLMNAAQIIRTHMNAGMERFQGDANSHYVVLIGNVGAGKSTIVERLTGVMGRSSNASESATRFSEQFWTPDGRILVCDTPGANPISDKMEHNMAIADGLNLQKVSRVFVTVKADEKIDLVIDNIRKFTDRFVDLEDDAVAILITHMDRVDWTKERATSMIDNELGYSEIVFASISSTQEELQRDILGLCTTRYDLSVGSRNFEMLFKIHDNSLKILKRTAAEVARMEELRKCFEEELPRFHGLEESADLHFEFLAAMEMQIGSAQRRLAQEMGFTFAGASEDRERGYQINMGNKMRMLLQDVKTRANQFRMGTDGAFDDRKCYHCGQVWNQRSLQRLGELVGTTCGPSHVLRRDATHQADDVCQMANFAFRFSGKTMRIEKRRSPVDQICGNLIVWEMMAPAPVAAAAAASSSSVLDSGDVEMAEAEMKEEVREVLMPAEDKNREYRNTRSRILFGGAVTTIRGLATSVGNSVSGVVTSVGGLLRPKKQQQQVSQEESEWKTVGRGRGRRQFDFPY